MASPPWVMRAPRVRGSRMRDPYRSTRIRRHFRLTLAYAVGARHGEPAGRPGTGKNAGKDEDDRTKSVKNSP